MAKDDYEVIAYKILVYLYAVMKRKIIFSEETFRKTIIKDINEDYFNDVIRLMAADGQISGASFEKAWGGSYMMLTDYSDMEITAEGIRYLKDNSKAGRAKEALIGACDIVANLIGILKL